MARGGLGPTRCSSQLSGQVVPAALQSFKFSIILFGGNDFEGHGDACQYLLTLNQLKRHHWEFAHLCLLLYEVLLALLTVHAQCMYFWFSLHCGCLLPAAGQSPT